VAAAVVGFIHMYAGVEYGMTLILFYVSSSMVRTRKQPALPLPSPQQRHMRAQASRQHARPPHRCTRAPQLTKLKHNRKAALQEGVQEGGQRGALQVGAWPGAA
jgi:hypothetical protein